MIKIPISRVKGLVINMNVGNRLLLVKYKERRKMELSENMLGNGRYVVKFEGKQYQYVGYHREKGLSDNMLGLSRRRVYYWERI